MDQDIYYDVSTWCHILEKMGDIIMAHWDDLKEDNYYIGAVIKDYAKKLYDFVDNEEAALSGRALTVIKSYVDKEFSELMNKPTGNKYGTLVTINHLINVVDEGIECCEYLHNMRSLLLDQKMEQEGKSDAAPKKQKTRKPIGEVINNVEAIVSRMEQRAGIESP